MCSLFLREEVYVVAVVIGTYIIYVLNNTRTLYYMYQTILLYVYYILHWFVSTHCAMILYIVLNPIALSMKYISKLLRSVKTMYATAASVLDNVMRCAVDIHSTGAVYHE